MMTTILAATGCASAPAETPAVAAIRVDAASTWSQLAEEDSLTVTFDQQMGTAVIARLADAVDVRPAVPVTSYRAGDLAYWPDRQSVVVFLRDGGDATESGELLRLGAVTAGMTELENCRTDCTTRLVVDAGE